MYGRCRKRSTEKIYRLPTKVKKGERQDQQFVFPLKKKEQATSKVSKRKEIIRIRAEINELENRKSTEKIKETKK